MYADMLELADKMDLESIGRPCRFKSCYPHQALKNAIKWRVWALFLCGFYRIWGEGSRRNRPPTWQPSAWAVSRARPLKAQILLSAPPRNGRKLTNFLPFLLYYLAISSITCWLLCRNLCHIFCITFSRLFGAAGYVSAVVFKGSQFAHALTRIRAVWADMEYLSLLVGQKSMSFFYCLKIYKLQLLKKYL